MLTDLFPFSKNAYLSTLILGVCDVYDVYGNLWKFPKIFLCSQPCCLFENGKPNVLNLAY